MGAVVGLLVLLGVLVGFLVRGARRRGKTVISGPRFAILNLKGADGAVLAEADKAALKSVFATCEESVQMAPKCDVLFVYADLLPDGNIKNSGAELSDLAFASGATIVVVASENTGEAYTASAKGRGFRGVNMVMTISRRGQAFARFFSSLFDKMMRGTSMPVAWNQLAPQIPGTDHADCPGTIFACGAGQVRFRGIKAA
jgi:hypothetical protein